MKIQSMLFILYRIQPNSIPTSSLNQYTDDKENINRRLQGQGHEFGRVLDRSSTNNIGG